MQSEFSDMNKLIFELQRCQHQIQLAVNRFSCLCQANQTYFYFARMKKMKSKSIFNMPNAQTSEQISLGQKNSHSERQDSSSNIVARPVAAGGGGKFTRDGRKPQHFDWAAIKLFTIQSIQLGSGTQCCTMLRWFRALFCDAYNAAYACCAKLGHNDVRSGVIDPQRHQALKPLAHGEVTILFTLKVTIDMTKMVSPQSSSLICQRGQFFQFAGQLGNRLMGPVLIYFLTT